MPSPGFVRSCDDPRFSTSMNRTQTFQLKWRYRGSLKSAPLANSFPFFFSSIELGNVGSKQLNKKEREEPVDSNDMFRFLFFCSLNFLSAFSFFFLESAWLVVFV